MVRLERRVQDYHSSEPYDGKGNNIWGGRVLTYNRKKKQLYIT